jgi:hypothetical protein
MKVIDLVAQPEHTSRSAKPNKYFMRKPPAQAAVDHAHAQRLINHALV